MGKWAAGYKSYISYKYLKGFNKAQITSFIEKCSGKFIYIYIKNIEYNVAEINIIYNFKQIIIHIYTNVKTIIKLISLKNNKVVLFISNIIFL